MFNLGVKNEGEKLQNEAEQNAFILSETERRVNYEKIKALKNPDDDLSEETKCEF